MIQFSELPTSKSEVTYFDISNETFDPNKPVPVLVTLVEFTDGYVVDHDEFEKRFSDDTLAPEDSLKSVASYYKYNSYGKVKFDFRFLYYSSPMSSNEAWHYVNDEDEMGHFCGNQFFFDVFAETKEKNEAGIDYRELDADGNGFVDASLFITAEDPDKIQVGDQTGGYVIYGAASGLANGAKPDVDSPNLKRYLKLDYHGMQNPLAPASESNTGMRVVIHELGHAFGLYDYYDYVSFKGQGIDSVGHFDMQSYNLGDWNPFSKFACGFLDPYVVQDVEDSITIRLGASAEKPHAILIPKPSGWNGTAFDEYILIDVCAPVGATGYDWPFVKNTWEKKKNALGGIRIYHVDARLELSQGGKPVRIIDPKAATEFKGKDVLEGEVNHLFANTNGATPAIKGESNFFHLIDLIPSDGTSKFRISAYSSLEPVYYPPSFICNDLFGVGSTFVLDENNHAFPYTPWLNCGEPLNYSVHVDSYSTMYHEATITISKIK